MHSLSYQSEQFSYEESIESCKLVWTQTGKIKINNCLSALFSRRMSLVFIMFSYIMVMGRNRARHLDERDLRTYTQIEECSLLGYDDTVGVL